MIAALEDAWTWYESVRLLTRHMRRLGERFWNREEWSEALGRDNQFRHVESAHIKARVETTLADLDDLGVLLLFSVFEAIVRDRAKLDVKQSLPQHLHPAVDHAIEGLIWDIENGSFGKVTDAYKGMDADLVEEVKQVRRYRNWVAHGRRGSRPSVNKPRSAYERLKRFLERMAEAAAGPSPGPEAHPGGGVE
jgi:hypothetical protein